MGERVARPRPIPLVAFHRGLEPALAPIPGWGQERRGTPPNAPPKVPHHHVRDHDRDHENTYAYDDAPYLGEWGR